MQPPAHSFFIALRARALLRYLFPFLEHSAAHRWDESPNIKRIDLHSCTWWKKTWALFKKYFQYTEDNNGATKKRQELSVDS